MSSKSSKPGKKLSVPRPMTEIQSAYQQLCANAGQVQYQLTIYKKELELLNSKIEAINNEGAARMKLDQEEKARQEVVQSEPKEEVAGV